MVEYSLLILVLSVLIDAIIGDPNSIHPVRGIGFLIARLEPLFYKIKNKSLGGALLIFAVSLIILGVIFMIIRLVSFNYVLLLIISAFVLKSTFALKGMKVHVDPVISSLKKGEIGEARQQISRIVRRDVSNLQDSLVCSAAIESISEGFVDGFANSIFFFSFGGIMGAMFARIASTFDSMIGYRDERYAVFGRVAAYLDSAVNFFPARISSYIFAIAARLSGLPSWEASALEEARSEVTSINAGWPMASFALILGVRLEKAGNYVINRSGRLPEISDVESAIRLFRKSALLYILLVAVPILLIISLA